MLHLTSTSQTSPGCDLVRQWLREHNWAVNPAFMQKLHEPEHEASPLILLAHTTDFTAESELESSHANVIGGLLAETQLSWLRISIMAVNPNHRSQGIGASLLAEAERQAVTRGCKYAYVDTMEYQAPHFYTAHGYQIVGQIPDWDSHGHTKFYLSKTLEKGSSSTPATT